MASERAVGFVMVAAAAAIAVAAIVVGPGSPREVRGVVTDATGAPVAGAVVRIQSTDMAVLTDERGRFGLPVPSPGESVPLTAWAEGYYIVGGDEHRAGDEASLALRPLPGIDDPSYEWLPSLGHPTTASRLPVEPAVDPDCLTRLDPLSRAVPPECLIAVDEPGGDEAQACEACHSGRAAGIETDLPVDEWLADAHSGAAFNPRLLTMYLGTDIDGNQSPPTRFVENRDYGKVPLQPDPTLPYFGPGYRLDFPGSFGNCATCHAPMAAIDDPYGIDPTALTGKALDGIGCDLCHKVWDVHLDEQTSLPDPNRPGVLSFEFRRPPAGHQYFAGPYDDVAPGEDTYVPLYSESAYCAPCHHGVFWDTVVYDSYGEWLASPYAEAGGRTCQDCHMPPTGATFFANPHMGGLQREPETIPGHRMPGAADVGLLQNAVTLNLDTRLGDDGLTVTVEIVNDQTGHHVPTDSPLRHMLLLVEATGADGPLALVEGPVVPAWGGVGDPATGHYAGLPGTAYAKVLEELWTEVSPTGAYWNQTRVLSDNRIPAMGSDTTVYRFTGVVAGGATVDVTLLFRRAYVELAEQKGWEVADIVMETATATVH